MKIEIEFVKDSQMRIQGGIGDYWYDSNGDLQIRIVDTGSDLFNKMILVHELCEEALTKHRGLPEPEIQDFDEAFFRAQKLGLRGEYDEPGFAEGCPYLAEHTLASSFEYAMCALAGERWADYENAINNSLL